MGRKPTIKQKRAAKLMLENVGSGNKTKKGQILKEAGYGTIVQDPNRILESEGYKQALAEYGLTEELVTTSLVSDIESKPKNRLGELRLGSEILGMNKREDIGVKVQFNMIVLPELNG